MRIMFESFMSNLSCAHPDRTREKAREYANRVWMESEENRIINITESLNKWGTVVTVWYEADRKVEV